MKTEKLARKLHEIYEEEAIKNNWNTQKNCKVDFDNLPEANKKTMIAVAHELNEDLLILNQIGLMIFTFIISVLTLIGLILISILL